MATAAAIPQSPEFTSSIGNTDFGAVEVGKSSAATPFTISITTFGVFLSGPPTLSGADAGDFTVTPDKCVTGFLVKADGFFGADGGPCTAAVAFTPRSAGLKTAVVTVAGNLQQVASSGNRASAVTTPCTSVNGIACTVSFTVTGSATTAPVVAAALTPATRVIRTGRTARVTLAASNPGTAALSNVVTSLPLPAGFIVTSKGGGTVSGRTITWTAASLAAGAVKPYTVTLRPIGLRARKATLITTVSATGAPSATATGTITVRAVKVKPRPVPVTG